VQEAQKATIIPTTKSSEPDKKPRGLRQILTEPGGEGIARRDYVSPPPQPATQKKRAGSILAMS
jgi:hypothetical protein